MRFLRQSTATVVVVGPFPSITTALSVTSLTDQSANGRLVKNGTGGTVTVASWSHDAQGHYLVGLSASHTDTIGRLRLEFYDAATYLPVWEDFAVLSAAVYDWLFGSTAPLTALPTIPADWLTASGLAADAVAEIQAGLATSAALAVVASYIDTEIADIRSRLPAALVGGRMDASVGDKTGFSLAATGLDAISVTDPGGVAGHTTLPKMMVALYRRFFRKMTMTTTQMKTYADDGTTVNTTQAVSDVAGTQTQGTAV